MKIDIARAETPEDFAAAETLIRAYIAYLDVDVSFQNYDHEITHLSDVYGKANRGDLILAKVDGEVAGSIGLKKFDDTRCEMKRLYVYPPFQGLGLGRKLVEAFLASARNLDYQHVLLDTIPKFDTAIKMYRKLGFYDIPHYYDNPYRFTMNVLFMQLDL